MPENEDIKPKRNRPTVKELNEDLRELRLSTIKAEHDNKEEISELRKCIKELKSQDVIEIRIKKINSSRSSYSSDDKYAVTIGGVCIATTPADSEESVQAQIINGIYWSFQPNPVAMEPPEFVND